MAAALSAALLPAKAEEPLRVEFVTVTKTAVPRTQVFSGEVVPRDEIRAAFRTSGRVTEVTVEEGDTVEAGDVLARIEDTQQQQSVKSAEASLSAANATLSQAKADESRQAQLLDRGFTTRAARDEARETLQSAEGSVAQAEAELSRARTALDDTVLRAPVAATVTDRAAEPGQVIGAAEAAITLAPRGEMDALFDVPDSLFQDPPDEYSISLALLDQPSVTMEGEVREISPLIDPSNGAVAVHIALKDPPEAVQIGAPVRGTLTTGGRPAVRLPWNALTATSDGTAVWLVGADGTVELRNIEVGRFESGVFTVEEGLEEGDVVVAAGSSRLYPGRPVAPVEAAQ